MDEKHTVSLRAPLVTGLVTGMALLALAVAYLLGDAGGPAPAQAAETAETAEPASESTLTMAGAGEATAVPDQVGFALSVRSTRPDLDTALDVSSATTRRVLAALAEHGVRKRDVQTTGLSMDPVYDYPQYGPPVLRGYRVVQRAQVLVPELRKGGAAIAAAVETGGNGVRVTDIEFSVADPDAVLAEARRAAVAEATTKAEEYAAATGQALGDVVTLREVAPAPEQREQWAQSSLSAYAADQVPGRAVPLRAGEEDLAVEVEVVWRIAD